MSVLFCRRNSRLTGPAAILFISRDACGDGIAKLFGAFVFVWGGIAQLSQ